MALKQNTSILCQLPLRQRGGDPGTLRSMWGRTDLRNQSVGEGIASELAGIPYGHLAPSSWNLPYQGGAMSAYTYIGATFTVDPLNVAGGVSSDGSSTITFTVGPSLLELISSAVGGCNVVFTVGPAALPGALNGSGSSMLTFTVGPNTLGAVIDLIGGSMVTFTESGSTTAIGILAGDITPYTPLSPENLAAAVIAASQVTPIVADSKNVVGNYRDQWRIRSTYKNRSRT
jgi:hypothetical protein